MKTQTTQVKLSESPRRPLEAYQCRECAYIYEDREYFLPILQCPRCGVRWTFERITPDFGRKWRQNSEQIT